jgi:hypothetical protein
MVVLFTERTWIFPGVSTLSTWILRGYGLATAKLIVEQSIHEHCRFGKLLWPAITEKGNSQAMPQAMHRRKSFQHKLQKIIFNGFQRAIGFLALVPSGGVSEVSRASARAGE